MADEPTDEEFDVADIDVELDGEEIDDELDGALEDDIEGADVVLEDEEDDEEVDAALASRPKREDEDDDEEDVNPDDVEADLDAILKDRIAAADDDDEDEEEVAPEPRSTTDIAEGVTPKKANEFTCTGCFLLVNRGQFGAAGNMHCPVGEAECPAIALIESGKLDTPAKKAATKGAAKSDTKPAAKKSASKSVAKAPAKSPAKKAAAGSKKSKG